MEVKRIASAIVSAAIVLSAFGSYVFAADDDIRFDFLSGAEDATAVGDSGASAEWLNGQLVLSIDSDSDLGCKTVGVALPEVDLGEGGYYMYVKAKYEFSANVAMGSHYATVAETEYDTSYEPWTAYKINSYDITSLSGNQSLNWIIKFSDSSQGTAKVKIEWIVFSKGEIEEPTVSDIRFDFISDTEGVLPSGSSTASTEAYDGECIVSSKDINLNYRQIQLLIPEVDLGEGGWFLYVKSRYELPDGIDLHSTYVAYSDAEDGTFTNATTHYQPWEGYKTDRFDIRDLEGLKYLKLFYRPEKKDITGVGKFYIDWIVLSKNSDLTSETPSSVIELISDGTNDIELLQNGEPTEIEYDQDAFDSLEEGIINGLPVGFTATEADGISDVNYSSIITDMSTYKLIDITATGTKETGKLGKSYRVIVKKMLDRDLWFDFTADLQGVTKAGADSIESADGACVLTTADGAIKNQMIQLILPTTDLGGGGYYLYAKIKYTTPSQQQLKMVNCVYESDGAWVVAEQKDSPNWQGYEVLRFDTSSLSGEQNLRLRFQLRGGEPDGVAQISVDYIVFSQSTAVPSDKHMSLGSAISNDGSEWTAVVTGEIEHSSDTQTADVYFVGYGENNELVECKKLDMTVTGSVSVSDETYTTLSQTISNNAIIYAMVFIWDEGIYPLCNANKYPID